MKVLSFSLLFLIPALLIAQPKLVFEGGEIKDWGKIERKYGPLKTEIKIKNTGNKDLEIFAVKPGCGCTTAPIDKSIIAPNDFATVQVTLRIDKDTGPIKKNIEITSNDPRNDKVNYFLKAYIVVPLSTFPKFLNFGNMNVNQKSESKLVISNNINKDIKVKNIKMNSKELKLNLKKGDILKAKTDFTLEATAKTEVLGRYAGEITIETDNKDMPELVIKLNGSVSGTGTKLNIPNK